MDGRGRPAGRVVRARPARSAGSTCGSTAAATSGPGGATRTPPSRAPRRRRGRRRGPRRGRRADPRADPRADRTSRPPPRSTSRSASGSATRSTTGPATRPGTARPATGSRSPPTATPLMRQSPPGRGRRDVDDLFTPAVPAGRPPVVEPLVLGPGGVVTGSHLDSVPGGGAYDGPLGVVTALAAIDLLREQGFEPRRAIGLVRFVDEEGARFGVPCTGSRLLTGQLEPGDVLGLGRRRRRDLRRRGRQGGPGPGRDRA